MQTDFKLTKTQNRLLWKQTKKELARQLLELRSRAKLTLDELNHSVDISSRHLEDMEICRNDISIGILLTLARFYGKKIKIELADIPGKELRQMVQFAEEAL